MQIQSRAHLALALWLSTLVAVPACAVPAFAQQTALVTQGRAFAEINCGRCHALGDTGNSAHPKAPPFRLVVERYPSENLAEALAEGIVTGHRDMPVFVLLPEEIEAFLAYLDSLGPSKRR